MSWRPFRKEKTHEHRVPAGPELRVGDRDNGGDEGAEAAQGGDPHLRSGAEVIGYGIEARDGAIGEVQDFIVDDKSWAIRDVIVDTTKWWPGGHVRVHPEYVERIDWNERKVYLRLTRGEVKLSGAASPRR